MTTEIKEITITKKDPVLNQQETLRHFRATIALQRQMAEKRRQYEQNNKLLFPIEFGFA